MILVIIFLFVRLSTEGERKMEERVRQRARENGTEGERTVGGGPVERYSFDSILYFTTCMLNSIISMNYDD